MVHPQKLHRVNFFGSSTKNVQIFFITQHFIEYELGLFSVFSGYTNFALKKTNKKNKFVKMRTNSATTREKTWASIMILDWFIMGWYVESRVHLYSDDYTSEREIFWYDFVWIAKNFRDIFDMILCEFNTTLRLQNWFFRGRTKASSNLVRS